jgi:predicted RNA methylase
VNETTRRAEADQPHPPGDPLGRVYTQASFADAILAHVFASGLPAPRTVVDPSCGPGALLDACRRRFPGIAAFGIDIDPGVKPGVLGDWPTIARFWGRMSISEAVRGANHATGWNNDRPDFVFTNPPFGEHVGVRTTIEHMQRSLDISSHVVAILPLPYLCGAEFDAVWRYRRPMRILRVTDRPWPDRLREVAVYEWRAGVAGTVVEDLDWHR